MKLVTYRHGIEAAARLGVWQDDLVIDVADLAEAHGEMLPDSIMGLIDLGSPGLTVLREMLAEVGNMPPAGTATAFANVTLLAPIPRPRKNRPRGATTSAK